MVEAALLRLRARGGPAAATALRNAQEAQLDDYVPRFAKVDETPLLFVY